MKVLSNHKLLHLCAACGVLFSAVEAQDNWLVTYEDVGEDEYKLVLEWDHNSSKALVIDKGKAGPDSKTLGDTLCALNSTETAPEDGIPYFMPRFFPREVPSEVTKKTGIEFASVDWQPCGHKDIVICHAESHYDFHLYYVPLASLPDLSCTGANPTCPDVSTSDGNKKFFSLMKGNMPKSTVKNGVKKNLDFCVDPTSAMPQSGIHYGDKSETLDEWKHPVTIMGSYDCKLTFFEPMISWRWITGQIEAPDVAWPVWESGELEYDEKRFEALPTSWTTEVTGAACQNVNNDANSKDVCHIKVTVRGKRCGAAGCAPNVGSCATVKDCKTSVPVGNMPPNTTTTTTTATTTTTVTPTTNTATPSVTTQSTGADKTSTTSEPAATAAAAVHSTGLALLLVMMTGQ